MAAGPRLTIPDGPSCSVNGIREVYIIYVKMRNETSNYFLSSPSSRFRTDEQIIVKKIFVAKVT